MGFDMNLKHLEYFITVARLGSINKAAQTLYISQPYLGKIIKELETNVGAVLFQRTRGGVILTPDGEDFMRHAINILREMEQMQHLPNAASASDQSLTVSMTKFSHIMECFIDVVLQHKDEPAFLHRLNEGTPEEVIEDVYSGQSNVGVIHFDGKRHGEMNAQLSSQKLNYHFLCYVKPHIVISREHPLIKEQKPINLHTLAPYGFIRYLGQCEDFTYRIFSESAREHPNSCSRVVYLTGRASLLARIAKSDFYSIGIHDFSNQISTYQALSVPLEDCDDMLEFGYILPSGTNVSPITIEFVEKLTKRLKGLE